VIYARELLCCFVAPNHAMFIADFCIVNHAFLFVDDDEQ